MSFFFTSEGKFFDVCHPRAHTLCVILMKALDNNYMFIHYAWRRQKQIFLPNNAMQYANKTTGFEWLIRFAPSVNAEWCLPWTETRIKRSFCQHRHRLHGLNGVLQRLFIVYACHLNSFKWAMRTTNMTVSIQYKIQVQSWHHQHLLCGKLQIT